MLERLPTAHSAVEQADKNHELLDNATENLLDVHEKFMLYQAHVMQVGNHQAHVMRVVNQNQSIKAHMKTLYDFCCEERNLEPLHLSCSIQLLLSRKIPFLKAMKSITK